MSGVQLCVSRRRPIAVATHSWAYPSQFDSTSCDGPLYRFWDQILNDGKELSTAHRRDRLRELEGSTKHGDVLDAGDEFNGKCSAFKT